MDKLSDIEKDTMAEVGNISLGAAATALSDILGREVNISTPRLSLCKISEVKKNYPVPCLLIKIQYLAGLEGSNVLVIKEDDAVLIAAQMMQIPPEEAGPELGEMGLSAIGEAMNQMMGFASTSMSQMFNKLIQITPPFVEKLNLADEGARIDEFTEEEQLLQIQFKIQVDQLLDSTLIQVIPLHFAKKMTSDLLSGIGEVEPPAILEPGEPVKSDTSPIEETENWKGQREKGEMSQNEKVEEPEPETTAAADTEEGAAALENVIGVAADQFKAAPEAKEEIRQMGQDEAGAFKTDQWLGGESYHASAVSLDRLNQVNYLREIPVEIVVVYGKTRVALGKLLGLGKGGIIELDNYVGEPVEVMVKDKLVARGEVVAINRQLGVRITRLETETKQTSRFS